jgi:hypothetical protein
MLGGQDNAHGDEARLSMNERVAAIYGEKCSSAFTTFILSWAISAIVQYLIRRWWHSMKGTPK